MEALWKAIRPAPSRGGASVPLPTSSRLGWSLSADGAWWVWSSGTSDGFVWTVVVRARQASRETQRSTTAATASISTSWSS